MKTSCHNHRTVWRIVLLCLAWIVPSLAMAATPAGYSEYYIPGDEDQLMYFHNQVSNRTDSTAHSVISVVAWAPNTIIYYDHWENGYNLDPANPRETCDEEHTLLARGSRWTGESAGIPTPRNPAQQYYDGRDRMYVAGGAVSVSRVTWPAPVYTLEAIGMEVYPVRPQLTTYIIPFGEDLYSVGGMEDFQRVYAAIQATENNTAVQFDLNGDGVPGDQFLDSRQPVPPAVTSIILNAGDCYLLDRRSLIAPLTSINHGTMIKASSTIQVDYLFCETPTTYESRGVSAFPTGLWDDEYYAPVDGDIRTQYKASLTDLYLYNPHGSPISINYETNASSGSFNITPNSTVSFGQVTGNYVPVNSAVYLKGSDVFWGISSINKNDSAYDWAYPLIPATLLQDEHFVGWAPGGFPVNDPPGDNDPDNNSRSDSGLFIAAARDNTRVFIDLNADGAPDVTYDMDRLQSQYVWDTGDGDMSGSNIWATGPISVAYGQNPDTSASGQPSIDTGDAMLPGIDFVDLVLFVEKSTDPVMLPIAAGGTTVYTVVVRSSKYTVDDVAVVDTLAPGWAFVSDSATITRADKTQLTGAAANPTIVGSRLTWPTSFLGNMDENQEITITFTAQNTAGRSMGDMTRNYVEATGYRRVGSPQVEQTFTTSDFVFNGFFGSAGQIQVNKTSGATDPLYPGDHYTYTVNVSNSGPGAITGVALYDDLPSGVSYVAGSSLVAFPISDNVRDQFGAVAYTNNNGSANWAGAWSETDIHGNVAGAGAGFVLVTGNQLQLRYQASNYRDDFTTNVYTRNDGTNNWSGSWTETGDDGAAGSGTVTVDASDNNRVNFGPGSGRSIYRTAAISGGSVTLSFTMSDNGIDNNEGIIAEYDLGLGAGWQEIQRITNGTRNPAANPINLVVDTAGATSITLRFRDFGGFEYGDNAGVDAVNITVNDAVGSLIQRTVDLTGATSATLTFDFNRANLEAGDTLAVEIDGGSGFTTLATYNGATATGSKSFDISSYISAATTIRYRVTEGVNATNEYFSIDNVDITYNGIGSAAANNPPNFISSGSGYSLDAGESITLTYQVSVDNPLSTGIDSITNSACVTADQLFVPICDEVTNSVTNPGSESARVGDLVWFDSDRDGSFDVGETGIPNVEVTLKDRYGTPISVTHTDGTGHYLFTGVALANGYYVEVTGGIPAGLTQTAPSGHTGVNADDRTDDFDLLIESTDNYRDEFIIQSYSNTDGSIDWSSAPWSETDGGGGGATGGNVLITGGQLRINNQDGGITNSIQRQIDFPDGFTSATLRFNYLSAGGLETDDYVYLEISTDGVNFTNLATYQQFVSGSAEIDIGGYASSNTIIRFSTNNQYLGGDEFFYVDNFDVTFTYSSTSIPEYLDADLGYGPAAGTGTLGDRVWIDADGDTLQDAGEPGLAGITVQLYRDVNSNSVYDAGDTLVSTTVTGAGGFYLLTNIPANGSDDYVVYIDPAQAALTGYTATTETLLPSTDLQSGETQLYLDYGFRNPSGTYAITDRVWYDPDSDENDDNGAPNAETGISGVTVDLLDTSRNVIATTVTNADGYFTFTGIPGGGADYTVRITDAGGKLNDYFSTTAEARAGELAVDNLDGNLDYTVEPGEPNFGYNLAGAIGDTLFIDIDGDGIQDMGESGINNVIVMLYRDVNSNGIFEPGGADGGPVRTLNTDGDGKYLFSGLFDATYFVHVDNTQTALTGYDQFTTTDDEMAAGHQRQVTVAGRSTYLEADFGYRPSVQRSVSGTVWRDAAEDGVIDPAESLFANVSIELLSGTTVIRTTTTDTGGYYEFTGLPAASYTVRLTDRNNVLAGYSTVYEVTEGLQKVSYDYQETVNLASADASGINFGYNAPVPTFALISEFKVYNAGGRIIVEWETSSEVGTAGFDLLRADDSGGYVQVNRKTIPAVMRPQGGIYRCVDSGAAAGSSQTYKLSEIEASGDRRVYGPYTVSVDSVMEALADDLLSSGYSRQAHEIKRPSRTMMSMSPASASRAGLSAAVINPTRIRLSLTTAGLYRIIADEIASTLGVSVDQARQWISLRQVLLSNKGASVSWLPFDDDSGLYFYGEKHETLFSDTNVYWLDIDDAAVKGDINGDGRLDGADIIIGLKVLNGMESGIRTDYPASGADVNGNNKVDLAEVAYTFQMVSSGGVYARVMGAVSGGSPAPVAGGSFETTIREEQDLFDMTHLFTDPEADYWFWTIIFAGEQGSDAAEFSFELNGMAAAGDDVELTIHLHGAVDGSGTPEHHARVLLNGTMLGEGTWNGADPFSRSFSVNPGLFNTGANTLRVEGLLDSGVDMSVFMVDGFELTYDRTYDAFNDVLEFNSDGNDTISLSGFSSDDICLLDLSDPGHPKMVTDAAINLAGGKYRVSFVPAASNTPYLAADRNAALTPDIMEGAVTPGLQDTSNAVAYLIITSDDMAEGALELADYRQGRGLSTHVATLGDIYDQFSFGINDPNAIAAFIAFAAANWDTPPQYVVLVGDGTYDYKDHFLAGDNKVPVLMTGTPHGLFPSDNLYTELNGMGTPDIPIGRIPVSSAAELRQALNKIIAHEANARSENILMVADSPDDGGNFPAGSDAVAMLVPQDYTISKIYRPALTPGQARQQLVDGINNGAYLVNYIGHGGYDTIGNPSILKSKTSKFDNTQQYPVLVALTCLAGGFSIPGFDSLSEELILQDSGGFVAAWSPSGLSINNDAVRLNQELFTAMFDESVPTLGRAVKRALERYKNGPNLPFMVRIYNLLGDPALEL